MRFDPLIMGVLNVTPDSFSDGGLFSNFDRALEHAEALVGEGADILDVGGESTRPGAASVGVQEEMDRVLPIIDRIRRTLAVSISVDTQKQEVAFEAVKAGATIVNDVSGGRQIRPSRFPPKTVFILMHMRGTPADMQRQSDYHPNGVVHEVRNFLQERVLSFESEGVPSASLWIDPGIGFSKQADQCFELLRDLGEFSSLGKRIVIGTSRKSFLSRVFNGQEVGLSDREEGTLASNLWAYCSGASVFRVHRVAPFKRALATWRRISGEG